MHQPPIWNQKGLLSSTGSWILSQRLNIDDWGKKTDQSPNDHVHQC